LPLNFPEGKGAVVLLRGSTLANGAGLPKRGGNVTEPERAVVTWRKSSSSDLSDCVEVAVGADAEVMVRNSHHPDGFVLHQTRDEFRAFLEGVRAGQLG
jgi:hypothetical protein